MAEFQGLIEDAMGKAVDAAVQKVIRETWGYRVDSDIKDILKERARKAIDESPELQQMILDALKSWISTQTAEDIRKARDDNIKRFGRR